MLLRLNHSVASNLLHAINLWTAVAQFTIMKINTYRTFVVYLLEGPNDALMDFLGLSSTDVAVIIQKRTDRRTGFDRVIQ